METTAPGDRRVPIRTCVGCRRRRPQTALFRCVLDESGAPLVSRSAPGRGGWICGVACIDRARRNRGFQRAWRTEISGDLFDRLRAELTQTTE